MSIETYLQPGELIKPFSQPNFGVASWDNLALPVKFDTQEGASVPIEVSFGGFMIEGRKVNRVGKIDAYSSSADLKRNGFADYNYDPTTGRPSFVIRPEYELLLKRIAFVVKLPDLEQEVTALPWRYGLVHNNELRFDFFEQPADRQLPVFEAYKREGLKAWLPALVLPPPNWGMLPEEEGRGWLAINPKLKYQEKIEVGFSLRDENEVKLTKVPSEIVIPVGWEEDKFFDPQDWAAEFESLPTKDLQAIYKQLGENTSDLQVNPVELDFMRDMLLAEGLPIDLENVTHYLMMLKATHLKAVEEVLKRRLTQSL